jgi:hypothetical protein
MEDTFIRNYVEDLLNKIRTQVGLLPLPLPPLLLLLLLLLLVLMAPSCRHGWPWAPGGSADALRRPAHSSLQPPPPRPQVLLKVVEPYTRVTIPFIAAKLNISPAEVEALVVSLILDGRVAGHIDQVRGGGRAGRGPAACVAAASGGARCCAPGSAPGRPRALSGQRARTGTGGASAPHPPLAAADSH